MAQFLPGPGPFVGLPEHVIDGSPANTGVWLPSETFPSPRNRAFFIVRGRQVKPLPPQEAPMLWLRPRGVRVRALPAIEPRGKRSFPVQAQIPVPAQVVPRTFAPWRWAALVRGRSQKPVLTQTAAVVILPPVGNRMPALRRLASAARGKGSGTTPVQSTPVRARKPVRFSALRQGKRSNAAPVQSTPIQAGRKPARLTAVRLGKRSTAAPVQATPVPRLGAVRRLVGLRRGKQSVPTAVQQTVIVPPTIPGNRWSSARSKLTMLRRGRQTNPVLTQAAPVAPPVPLPKLGAVRRLLGGMLRGRQNMVVPPQAVEPPPPPPPPEPPAEKRQYFHHVRDWF